MSELLSIQQDSELIFSRYLYSNDEVFLSMISSMLQQNLHKTLFWFGEWIYTVSDAEAKKEIWKIYYDFYSIVNPKLERYIEKKFKLIILSPDSEKNINNKKNKNPSDIQHFANIIKNLVVIKPNCDVFLLRQYIKNAPYPTKVFRGRRPKWLQDFNKEYQTLLLSLSKRNWYNICFYYNLLFQKETENKKKMVDDLHNVIITYFQTIEKKLINMEFVFKKWSNTSYNNREHLLLAIIVYLTKEEEDIVYDKKMFVTITEKENTLIHNPELFYMEVNKQDDEGHGEGEEELQSEAIKTIKPYQQLKYARLYQIEKTIGSFNLTRFNLSKPLQEFYRHHWEYFASRSDIWRERFKRFHAKTNDDSKTITFKDDPEEEKYEQFYETFGYEPDEQSSEIQQKSICEIPKTDYKVWLEKHFQDTEFIIEIKSPENTKKTFLMW